MKIKTDYKYTFFITGITLAAIAASLLPWRRVESKCFASQGQTVVRWKDLYYGSCKRTWNGYCIWPLRRPHSTYKVTVNEGIALRDERRLPIPMAGGKVRKWEVYDATTWNGFQSRPSKLKRFPDYEPIAENEYVVLVETRYRLLHDVEANLRICTQNP